MVADEWVPVRAGPPRAPAPPPGPESRDRVVLAEFRGLAGHAAVMAGMGCALLVLTGLSTGNAAQGAQMSFSVWISLYSLSGVFPFLVAGNIVWRHFLIALASPSADRTQMASVSLMLTLMAGAVASFFGPDPHRALLWAQAAPGALLAALAYPYSRAGGRWPGRFVVGCGAAATVPLTLLAVAAVADGGYLTLAAQMAFTARSGDTLLTFVPPLVVFVAQAPLFAMVRLAPLRLRDETGAAAARRGR